MECIQIEIPEGSGIRYTIDHVIDEQHLVTTQPVPAGLRSARVFPPENSQIQTPEEKFDTWYLTLNADPTTDTWTQVPVSRVPAEIVESALTYDPDDDVFVLFGYDQGSGVQATYLFCSTDGNACGSLSATQENAGCIFANDWTEALVGGNPVSPASAGIRLSRFGLRQQHQKRDSVRGVLQLSSGLHKSDRCVVLLRTEQNLDQEELHQSAACYIDEYRTAGDGIGYIDAQVGLSLSG